ncbi:MAG: hypothetical protein BWY13_00345 [Euryarchaeota archaeon ADurb.Bin190]|nr:MAG: hypothetical protein BWY13_00345 [Euryarchaeota archaeon ADurb.Bin190]
MQQIGHLIAALAASHIYHNVHICPLGQGLLHNRLSGAEASGNGCRSALGQGEESVYYSLSCSEGDGRSQLFGYRSGLSYRPLMHHGQLSAILQDADSLIDGKVSAVYVFDGAALHLGWDHDLVIDEQLLLNLTEGLAGLENIALLGCRLELPLLLVVNAIHE